MPFLSLRVFEVHKINEIVIKLKKKKKKKIIANLCRDLPTEKFMELLFVTEKKVRPHRKVRWWGTGQSLVAH